MPDRHTVKSGTVTLNVVRHPPHGWRFAWKDESGKWRYVHRKQLKDAKEAALNKAKELATGNLPLSSIPPEKAAVLRRILTYDFGVDQLREFEAWLAERAEKRITVREAVDGYIMAKTANSGSRHIENLKWAARKIVARFGARMLDEVKAAELNKWLEGSGLAPKSKQQLRASTKGLFRWCRDHGHLSESKITEADKMEKPKIIRKIPKIWTPDELGILLREVSPKFLGWLVVSAFCGMRTAEAQRLNWCDVRWDTGILIVPPEASKTGERRIVHVPDAVRLWLPELPGDGKICSLEPTRNKGGKTSETKRLGEFVGGKWRPNALRHSWISYRAALVGIAQTALEAGNSEAIIRRHYKDAVTETAARRWFNTSP